MSTLMIPFNNQPANTIAFEGTTGGDTYTVPAGKYVRVDLTSMFGGKAEVSYASGGGFKTILHTKPDNDEADGSSVKASKKAIRFAVSATSGSGASGMANVDITLPGDSSDICKFYLDFRTTNIPLSIAYISQVTDSNHSLPVWIPNGSTGSVSNNLLNHSGAAGSGGHNGAEEITLPGGVGLRARFQANAGATTDGTLYAFGTILREQKFDAVNKTIWLVAGDQLKLTKADWSNSFSSAHIEEYNNQA
jgi:hypothetical protein